MEVEMSTERQRPFTRVHLEWLIPEGARPTVTAFGATAYRGDASPTEIFSIYVVTEPHAADTQSARIFALVPGMDDRLIGPNESLLITSGAKVVARATGIERGLGRL
jgi:hypothetical protein